MGIVPPFVKTSEVISPFNLYKKFQLTDSHGLVSVQFLAALNVFMGGDKTISKNAMSEFFNNLSMQVLSRDDDRIEIRFEAITELNRSFKNLFKEDQHHSSRLSFVDFTPQTYQEIKDPNQLIEEDVVNNVISGNRLEHPQDTDHMTFLNAREEIAAESKTNQELEYRVTQAVNAHDVEISQEIVQTARNELVNTFLNVEGEIAAEVIQDLSDVGISSIKTNDKNVKKKI